MCGVAGLIGVAPHRASAAARPMLAALRHRGPDDHEIAQLEFPNRDVPPVTLIHTRLSILDPSPAGHQPMSSSSSQGRLSIVYNGEIYNFHELQRELTALGAPATTHCDTETILLAYRVWGEECVHRLRGMFAFCIIDEARGTAWFCRDRFGIKPLYLTWLPNGGLAFASEVRCLLASGLVRRAVRAAAVESLLAYGSVWGDDSIVADVSLLGAGESLTCTLRGDAIERRKYWALPTTTRKDIDPDDEIQRLAFVERTRIALSDSVRLHLIADVPVGMFLSGGVDSSALSTLATTTTKERITTVTIGFDDARFDESAAAATIAARLGTEHRTTTLVGREVLESLDAALAAADQPTIDGFNTYFVSRATRSLGLKVALSGLGGDELFGGYPSFRDVPRLARWRERLGAASRLHAPITTGLRRLRRRSLSKMSEAFARAPDLVSLYLLRREQLLPAERRRLMPLPPHLEPDSALPGALVSWLRNEAASDDDRVNDISRLELMTYMRHTLLRDADVFSMAHGLELRVPFLDHRVVDTILPLPGTWKRPDPRAKPLLVDAIGPELPRAVVGARKMGFAFPWDRWLRGPMRSWLLRTLESDVWPALGIRPAGVRELLRRFEAGRSDTTALHMLALAVLSDFAGRHQLACS